MSQSCVRHCDGIMMMRGRPEERSTSKSGFSQLYSDSEPARGGRDENQDSDSEWRLGFKLAWLTCCLG